MPIDLIETSRRTIVMMANFLHRAEADINLGDDLRQKWLMTKSDFEDLEIWIEGPIGRSRPGYFQDVRADVSPKDLNDVKLTKTVAELTQLIWRSIPAEFKA